MSRQTTHEYHVTECTIPVDMPAETVISQLTATRATGELKFHFVEGGLRSVTLTKRTKIVDQRPPQRHQISRLR